MDLAINDFGYVAGNWRVQRHPRFVANLTSDGRADIVGFGDGGVWASLSNGDGTFQAPIRVVEDFAYVAGGWRVQKHPRMMADLTGDGNADIVGFGNDGVWVSLGNGDGTFQAPTLAVQDFGHAAGGWRVDRHPRFLADLTGDGRGDIVGFGNDGVWVSLGNGDGTFRAPTLAVQDFGHVAGGWHVRRHPRMLADLTGDGRADIVGFGNDGVWVSLGNGDGTFAPPTLAVLDFGHTAGGWRVDRHPRILTDLTGDGRADIIGFGNDGVWVSLGNGDGTFQPPTLAIQDFGHTAGSWRVNRHPRILADLTGDGRADIIGFGNDGVWTSLGNGDGSFAPPTLAVRDLGYLAGGWRVDRHPRFAPDLTGNRCADLVGFGDGGVWVVLNSGDGSFPSGYVRRNIWDLEGGGSTPWDPVTLAYALAIRALQARPLADPTSWGYQSAVHGRNGPALPGAVWNECQHGSWFFLSWHRMYLYYFERIIRAEVVAQGGPSDWALPFWDYSAAGQASLPPAFREPTMPDGSANPLFIAQRVPGANNGGQLPPAATSSAAAMAAATFTPPPAPGFGGGKTSPQHFFGAAGELEFTPHNIVHSILGGWMGDPNQAASDPIFWLHHCNIDRLWEAWLLQGGGRANPPDSQWRTTGFVFHDESGAQAVLTGDDIVDTVDQLDYRYEGVGGGGGVGGGRAVADRGDEAAMDDDGHGFDPELVGASEQPVELAGSRASVEVLIDQRTTDAIARERGSDGGPTRVYLNLEDIEGERNPSVGYEVFVDTTPESAGAEPSHYVGTVSFFGIEHLSATGRDGEGPHGLRRTFDITALAAELDAVGQWDAQRLIVTFRPLGLMPPPGGLDEREDAAASEDRAAPVRVGRVSLFYG